MTEEKTIRLPGHEDRLTEIGKTGSGKTVGALWQLSKKNFKELPWVILDFKREDFSEVNAKRIGYTVPEHGGLYIIQPRLTEKKELEKFLWEVWDAGNVGIYVDEAYMIDFMGANDPYIAILTQGRSKQIPMINLIQRPVYVSRFVISEAQFVQVFKLSDMDDFARVQEFIKDITPEKLPRFYSWYFDDVQETLSVLKPVPDKQTIIQTINEKIYSRKI